MGEICCGLVEHTKSSCFLLGLGLKNGVLPVSFHFGMFVAYAISNNAQMTTSLESFNSFRCELVVL